MTATLLELESQVVQIANVFLVKSEFFSKKNTYIKIMTKVLAEIGSEVMGFALLEDIGSGDVTTDATVPVSALGSGEFIVKQKGVVAGLEALGLLYSRVNADIQFEGRLQDGAQVFPSQILAIVSGPLRDLLTTERIALNFLQRMSGIATMTRAFVDAIRGTRARILDTRKTAPGLRAFDKWAVRLGGGGNHRQGLFDMALIKENHITVAGGIGEALRRVREHSQRAVPVEVEVQSLYQLQEALEFDVDRILLDNMNLEEIKEAVRITSGRVPLEASGNVNLSNVASLASTGVDFISVGMLTHSVQALDISFLITNVSETSR